MGLFDKFKKKEKPENIGPMFLYSEKELEAALMRLYKDSELREQMGQSGRRFVEDNFRQELVWKEIEKL